MFLAHGVAPRDILPGRLHLYRFYHRVNGVGVARYGANRELTVVLRNAEGAKRTVAAAVAAGGDRVTVFDLSYGLAIRHRDVLTRKARVLALADATAKAKAQAAEAGRPLGRIHSIDERVGYPFDDVVPSDDTPFSLVRAQRPTLDAVPVRVHNTIVWDLGPDAPLGTPRTVTAAGTGVAMGPARDVTVEFDIERVDARAPAAREEVAAGLRRIRRSLADHGVADSDIRTKLSDVSLIRYLKEPRRKAYLAHGMVEVLVRAVDTAERTIRDAVTAGGRSAGVQGITYTVARHKNLVRIALAGALAAAREATEDYGRLTGLSLGKAVQQGHTQHFDLPYAGEPGVATRPGTPAYAGVRPGAGQVEALTYLVRDLG